MPASVPAPLSATVPANRLIVDLDALVANWRRLDRLSGQAECGAAVKADAYGLGLVPVAKALAGAGCRTFFVAHAQEAIALRAALADVRIVVLHGVLAGEEKALAAAHILPALNDLGQVALWRGAANALGRPLPAFLQVDTGMNRLGLPEEEVAAVERDPDLLAGVALQAVMSHLYCADQPGHAANGAQLARFRAIRARLPYAPGSLANSAGILLGGDYAFDLVRPGIALYGARARDGDTGFCPVVRLQGRILQVHDIDQGETVGYGAAHRSAGPAKIATVAMGYADGYPRAASGRGRAWLNGQPVPVVGRVSMDLITVDATAAAAHAVPGASIDFLGPDETIDDLAAASGMFSYEILTRLGSRLTRSYVGGAS
ncbi:alanine racemase [Zavarzinia sp. CC-PAN008]|uniref:alanine racemase n=1 Tax=Zavarzinia sp. CC-PAN008 TaxID=3243332 RepID=UPI003F7441DE